MALPSSGAISMSQINTELGRSSTAAISLDTAENGGYAAINTCGSPYPSASNPASMSEWRGYNHTAACAPAAYNTFAIVNTGYDTNGKACEDRNEDNLTLYFSGSGETPACPAQGVTLYTNSALSTVFNGGGSWWKSNQCNAAHNILSQGYIEGILAC